MRGAELHSDSSLVEADELTPPPSFDRPPLLWPGLRGALGTVFAVVSVVMLQVILATYYWIADPSPATVLAPTWDLPALVLILVVWAAVGPSRWASRALVIGLSVVVFLYFVMGVGQGFALREFGYDVVMRLHASYVPELFRMMYGAEPLGWFIVYCALLALGVVVLALIVYGSVRHLHAFALRGRRRQVGLVTGVAAAFALGAALLGVNGPVTAEAYRQVDLAVNLKERVDATARSLDMEGAALKRLGPFAPGVEKPNILVFVVESYGHVMFTDPDFAEFPPWLEKKGAELAQAGYQAASKTIHAPVFGGSSWLAASTLLCGVSIHNQKRYEGLFASGLRCLPALLNDAGYHTVTSAANTKYLEDRFARVFPFDKYYFLPDFGYRGPRMGWSFMPDQLTIDRVHRREIAPRLGKSGAAREPLFVTFFLTSSHHPWGVIPPFIEDWSRVGDGSIYNQLAATRFDDNRFVGGAAYKPAYRTSVQYSLHTVASYLAMLPRDDRSLIIILGDHQPRRPVAGMKKDTWYVPIHVLSRDPAAVARFGKHGYQPGFMAATPKGMPSGMQNFTEELFAAYSDAGARR